MAIEGMREEQMKAEWLLNMPFCVFCSAFHRSEHCPTFSDTVSRILHLLRMKLCLVCMSHQTSLPCPRATYVCPMCEHMNHHVAVCYLNDTREDIVDVYEHELMDDNSNS